jgi:hypothetical protein
MNVPTVASTTTHTEVSKPQFGYVASPRDFFTRALDAKDRAESIRAFSGTYLADRVIEDPDPDACAIDYATRTYREDVARSTYARAVYQVEREKLDARRGLTHDDRAMSYAHETAAAMGRA